MPNLTAHRTPLLPNFAWPGVILIAVAVYSYLTFRPPYESQRPETSQSKGYPAPPAPAYITALQGRLWEDPLDLVYNDPQRSRIVSDITALREHYRFVVGATDDFTVMPVMVPGGNYAEDIETRRRIRYALLSALYAEEYTLRFPQRMSYVTLNVAVAIKTVERLQQYSIVPLDVPIKLYAKDSDTKRVLVCWIDESQIGKRPLEVLAQILDAFFRKVKQSKGNVRLSVIGPSSSDMLLSIAEDDKESIGRESDYENWKNKQEEKRLRGLLLGSLLSKLHAAYGQWPDALSIQRALSLRPTNRGFPEFEPLVKDYFREHYKAPTIYSPRATIDAKGDGLEFLQTFDDGQTHSGISLVRTIGSDRQLVDLIKSELKLRGAWPTQRNKNHLLLITERDTKYGRAIERLFVKAFVPPDQLDLKDKLDLKDRLHLITYLRGIDGERPTAIGPSNARNNNKDTKEQNIRSRQPLPIGRSQTDYLERLRQRILELPEEIDGQISAIGVVGTDIYDKMLVLRALKMDLPDTMFFTTDLDARLHHPEEYLTTRNLLVASHFGLRLDRALQSGVAPFRDSYQTATYFAVRRALESKDIAEILPKTDDPSHDDPWGLHSVKPDKRLTSLMFEIGRHGPYQMTRVPQKAAKEAKETKARSIHPPSSRQLTFQSPLRVLRNVMFSVAVTLILILLVAYYVRVVRDWLRNVWQSRRTLSILAALLVILAVVIGIDHQRANGEPFAWSAGISIWPSTLVRFLVVAVSIGLLIQGQRDVDRQRGQLFQTYFSVTPRKPRKLQQVLWRCRIAWRKELGACCAELKDLIGGRIKFPDWVQLWKMRWKNIHSLKDLEAKYSKREPISVEQIARDFERYDQDYRRCARIVGMTFLFFVFAGLLMCLTEFPNRPFRGWWSRSLSLIALYAAVLTMLALIFYVLDAIRACGKFVDYLGHSVSDLPTDGLSGDPRKRDLHNVPGASEIEIVQLIAQRTNDVGKLVLYPFIVALLMMLSRNPRFDDLDYPITLIIVNLLLLGGVILSALSLRAKAHRVRRQVVRRLREMLLPSLGSESADRAEQLREVIAVVESEQRGAFRPITQDWLFRAMAIPIGGVGALAVLEQVFFS